MRALASGLWDVTIWIAVFGAVAIALAYRARKRAEEARRAAEEERRRKYRESKYAQCTGNGYEFAMSDEGAYGEWRLGEELEALDPGARLLFNAYVPKGGGAYSEVDALYVNATGIYVFEVKNYSGWIFGSPRDSTWTETFRGRNNFTFPNPVRQNAAHINALKAYLNLADDKFCSIVVFGNVGELKKVDGGGVPVVKMSQVQDLVRNLRASRPLMIGLGECDAIYEKLRACTNAPEEVKAAHVERVQRDERQSVHKHRRGI